ncbi:hypothetical protein [Rhizobium sullae]|uniref:Uncharacterized protein n=1 Tax=Rhizobium sullae TaxID=50338 RepID=A0A4V2V8Z4_RHISU|nr:hypothetical protein [Rhizobium sullae]TCU15165.1 hypothetical protein EV132_10764 [Rhizobium sullae]
MAEHLKLKVGATYISRKTGKKIVVTAIEDGRVYFTIEGFNPISPLFLPTEKFIHLVGLDQASH